MWIVSYIWNDHTCSEGFNSQALALERIYKLRHQGKDAYLHYRDEQ